MIFRFLDPMQLRVKDMLNLLVDKRSGADLGRLGEVYSIPLSILASHVRL